jgi:hypothetical protein
MSKNRQGFVRSGGNQEWGPKARKEEDRLRNTNALARQEALDLELAMLAEAESGRWDDDPNPYHGDYSEC